MSKVIEINGVSYQRNEVPEKEPRGNSRMFNWLVASMAAYEFTSHHGLGVPIKSMPDVNIESEFELIQNKQSKLSRTERDWVIQVFNQNYTKL